MHKVKEVFDPDVVVCQCGADCLSGDPLGGFNLTNKGLTQSVKYIANWNLPLLILGGGKQPVFLDCLIMPFES